MSEGPEVRNVADGVSARNIVQARDIGQLHLHSSGPARSRYREQVREITPAALVGRDEELTHLAEFCTAQVVKHSYLWVRGTKWVGKSALMSWFVLHPPVNTRIVSFFVTARYGDQDHRGAFLDVVMEQLAELLDEPAPLALSEANRESHFRGLLADAAEHCRGEGERLVLLVDGLDEDRGWRAGGGSALSHSIAALLPSRLPGGLRVIVSGRPNPPLPPDVRADHPLRDPRIVHPLAQSSAARVIQDDMELELGRLLDGTPAEQDLLGLTVAAAGGLSAVDLAELTDSTEGAVRRLLRTVAGRSFDIRPSRWQPGRRPDVYLLGHEELQVTAKAHIGRAGLGRYRERLHTWADRHRAERWPETTPEYLLRGYFRMLVADGDLARMLAITTDPDRHDRMSEVAGGDVPALAELDIVRNTLAERHDRAALAMTARQAVHRDRLEYRNGIMPSDLAAVWAALGHVVRAEAVARMLYGKEERAVAVVAVAGTVARAGDLSRARELIDSIAEPAARLAGIAEVAEACVAAGDRDAARLLVATAGPLVEATAPHRSGRAEAAYLRALVAVGDVDAALARYESSGGGRVLREATSCLVGALLLAGLTDRAELVASGTQDPGQAAEVHLALAAAWYGVGDRDRAEAAVALARGRIAAIKGEYRRQAVTMSLVRVLACGGDHAAAAESLSPGQPAWVAESCMHLAAASAPEDARKWLRRAESAAMDIASFGWRANVLTEVAIVVAETGDVDDAVRIVATIDDEQREAAAFARLAKTMVAAGRAEDAAGLASLAESVARAAGVTDHHDSQARQVMEALARAGEFDRAEAMVAAMVGDYRRDVASLWLVWMFATSGLPTRAEQLAESIDAPDIAREALTALVEGWVAAGEIARAEALARWSDDNRVTIRMVRVFVRARQVTPAARVAARLEPGSRAVISAGLMRYARRAGEHALADRLADEAESLCRELSADRMRNPVEVVRLLALQGEFARAERIVDSLPWSHTMNEDSFPHGRRTSHVDEEIWGDEVRRWHHSHWSEHEAHAILDEHRGQSSTQRKKLWSRVDPLRGEPEWSLPVERPALPVEQARENLLAGRWEAALPALAADRDILLTVVTEFERVLARRP